MRTTLTMAALAALTAAQESQLDPLSFTQSNDPSISYTTVDVYTSCSDLPSPPMDTITSTIIQTTCPQCGLPPTLHTTVYTTVFQSLCPTGLVPVTYTVTETCTGPTPTFGPTGSDYVPSGFTVTQTICTACGSDGGPATVTITQPCDPTDPVGPGPTGTMDPESSMLGSSMMPGSSDMLPMSSSSGMPPVPPISSSSGMPLMSGSSSMPPVPPMSSSSPPPPLSPPIMTPPAQQMVNAAVKVGWKVFLEAVG
ncbi:hypothetical protein EJ06DRAFT_552553 [Trichodelitschia bisporula]|uniref:Uncharacterized protein n=1 Tax=Trichodelitschia bisporula TaxID=703511 RepID=A0A6G1IAV2_9PEZI|nr:hypothetical protein EJ06DRAFT_552553 [Trichodelitschia bisporula]